MRPDSFFNFKKKRLHVESLDLEKVARQWGTPTYIYSEAAFMHPIRQIKKAIGRHPHLICFAVKANSNLHILKFLSRQGLGADVVSGGELELALRAGIPAQHIVFSGVGKTRDEIRLALRRKIYSFHVESMDEWETLASLAPKKTRYALRIIPEVAAGAHPYISTGREKNKFGLIQKEWEWILKKPAKTLWLGGISVHIGSQILSLTPFEKTFSLLKKHVETVEAQLQRKLDFVDVGGGLGVNYTDEKPPAIGAWIRLARRHFPRHRLLFEPGRLIAANAGLLLTSVIRTKKRNASAFVVVDGAMNDLMRPSLYQSKHRVLPHQMPDVSKKTVRLVGPVCESSDVLSEKAGLSTEIKSGSLVAILSCGAYGMSMASNYNFRMRPAEVWVSGKKMTLIRKRETLTDLIADFDLT